MATSGTSTITAGESSKVVDHTYGTSSFTVIPNFDRDVGTVWFTAKTATQFTIHITNVDLEADTDFTWAIAGVSAVSEPSATQYAVIANILAMPDVPAYAELGFATESAYEDYVSRLVDRASRQI